MAYIYHVRWFKPLVLSAIQLFWTVKHVWKKIISGRKKWLKFKKWPNLGLLRYSRMLIRIYGLKEKKPIRTDTKQVSPECRWYSRHAGLPVWQGKEGGRSLLNCIPVARIETIVIFLHFSPKTDNNISCAQLSKLKKVSITIYLNCL